MTVTINFETDNAAFEDDGEIGKILREIADKVDVSHASGSVRDSNGQLVGKYEIIPN